MGSYREELQERDSHADTDRGYFDGPSHRAKQQWKNGLRRRLAGGFSSHAVAGAKRRRELLGQQASMQKEQ